MDRIDTFILTAAILILAIGTATGNAMAMLVTSVFVLVTGLILRRKHLSPIVLPVALAIVVGAAIGTILLRL